MTKRAMPSASQAGPSAPMAAGAFIGTGVLAILAALGILATILILISPVFQMIAYVLISAGTVYFLAKVIGVKKRHKPLYFLSSFFALLSLMIIAPVFMSFFPATTLAVTGEAALAQATAGEAATQSQMFLSLMPVIGAGTLVGIAAGRAKTTTQLILLSVAAVLISTFIVFSLLIMG